MLMYITFHSKLLDIMNYNKTPRMTNCTNTDITDALSPSYAGVAAVYDTWLVPYVLSSFVAVNGFQVVVVVAA